MVRTCPVCDAKLNANRRLSGRRFRCPQCLRSFRIPWWYTRLIVPILSACVVGAIALLVSLPLRAIGWKPPFTPFVIVFVLLGMTFGSWLVSKLFPVPFRPA